MNSVPVLCYVLVNMIHYHDARHKGVASTGALQAHVIQLTDTDVFRALEPTGPSDGYTLHTLFKGIPWKQVDRRGMVDRLHRLLAELRPSYQCQKVLTYRR
jgi:hypothetical protein